LLPALGKSADFPPRSSQPLRTHAMAASTANCGYAGVVAAPPTTAEPFNFSVSAKPARRFVARVPVTTREKTHGPKHNLCSAASPSDLGMRSGCRAPDMNRNFRDPHHSRMQSTILYLCIDSRLGGTHVGQLY